MKNKKIPILKIFIILLIVGWTCFSFVNSVKAAVDDSSLSSLTIDQGVLNPVFASSTLNYTAVVPYTVESLNITPTVNSPGEATLTINGTSANSGEAFDVNLSVGSNTITTVVTSQDLASVTTYTVVVTRENLIAMKTSYVVGTGPAGVAFDGTNIWVANVMGSSVSKISPLGEITTYSGTGAQPTGIAFDGVNMWTANQGNSVSKITPTGDITTYSGTGNGAFGIAFDGVNMWVTNAGDSSVTKVSPTGEMTAYYLGAETGPYGIAFDGVNMWTANQDNNSVSKISPAGDITTYSGTGNGAFGIAFDGVNMWVTNAGDSSVTKVSPTGEMTTYTGTGAYPYFITFDGTNMWTANVGGESVTKINVTTNDMVTYSDVGTAPCAVVFDGDNIWASNIYSSFPPSGAPTGSNVTKISFAEVSSDSSLSNLSINLGALSPVFASSTFSYTATDTEENKVTVTPTAGDENASITVNGSAVVSGGSRDAYLNHGENTVNIIITATDGVSSSTYQIVINKTSEDPVFTTLHEFNWETTIGQSPKGDLLFYNGKLYGMTEGGNTGTLLNNNDIDGTIFSIDPDGTDFTVLHYFEANENPQGSLILSADNTKLYGMTYGEWDSNADKIFSIDLDGSNFTVLYEFDNGGHSVRPHGSLLLFDNKLYGMTTEGGIPVCIWEEGGECWEYSYGSGTIFSIDTDGSDFNLIHQFAGGVDDGASPYGSLIISNGTLYGMTRAGGDSDAGTIFSIPAAGGSITLLYEFAGYPEDGAYPYGSLIISGDTLYGMTTNGGDLNDGIIFSIPVAGGVITTLHEFAGGADDGATPYGSLIISSGTLYGMTKNGGDNNNGTIFSIPVAGGSITLLHEFLGTNSSDEGVITDGRQPYGSLILSDGTLYGMTSDDGGGNGIIFSINTDASNYSILYRFGIFEQFGMFSTVGLIPSEDGQTFYGTTGLGGVSALAGTIFSVKADGTDFRILHNFTGDYDGIFSLGSLTLYNGKLYGGTVISGPGAGSGSLGSGGGILFSINTDGTDFTRLHIFADLTVGVDGEGNPIDGMCPFSQLYPYNGKLYGTTERGGINDKGVIFFMNPDGSDFQIIYNFEGGELGADPYGYLTFSDGKIYGMTNGNSFAAYLVNTIDGTPLSEEDSSVVFSFDLVSLEYNVLHVFSGGTNDGDEPLASALNLIEDKLYGLTYLGGAHNMGTIFSVNTDGTDFSVLHSFAGGEDGSYPWSSMIVNNGKLYGMTSGNQFTALIGIILGSYTMPGSGTIFSIDPDGSNFRTEYYFYNEENSSNVFSPGALTFVNDKFYGMTTARTTSTSVLDVGTVFSLTLSESSPAALSSDSSLSNLTVNQGTLTPTFSSGTLNYTLSVASSISTINIIPTVNDSGATVTVNGASVASGNPASVNLFVGQNTVNIVITAEDETITTYTFVITRAEEVNNGGSVIIDYNPPREPEKNYFSVLINDGAEITSSPKVNLNLYSGVNTVDVSISDNPEFENAYKVLYEKNKLWDLCGYRDSCPDGTYTVYVKYHTGWGYYSEVVSDSIILKNSKDDLKPEQSVSDNTSTGNTIENTNLVEPDKNIQETIKKILNQPFTKNLRYRQTDNDIKRLQIFLNQDLDTRLAKTGPGSPGKETNYFGPLTRAAVIKFQEKYFKEILNPLDLEKGTGFVGPYTRAKINQMLGF
ncbi:MAG: choice-of-anchor tandem repeat GloVer-containing protein [Patescibacteria group bacterium]